MGGVVKLVDLKQELLQGDIFDEELISQAHKFINYCILTFVIEATEILLFALLLHQHLV